MQEERRTKSQTELLVNIGKAHDRLYNLVQHDFYDDLSKHCKVWQHPETDQAMLLYNLRCHLQQVHDTVYDVLSLLDPLD